MFVLNWFYVYSRRSEFTVHSDDFHGICSQIKNYKDYDFGQISYLIAALTDERINVALLSAMRHSQLMD